MLSRPITSDNKDVVDGLDKLGKDIKDGNKIIGGAEAQHGYDTSEKNKFVMEKKAIEDRRKAQDEFKKAIEAQGGDVKNNYKFQREQTKITKADFALKRKLADTPGSKKELKKEEAEGIKTDWHKTTLLVLAITLHNIPEGLAIGVLFGAASTLVGVEQTEMVIAAITLAIGIGIQNFPEGFDKLVPMLVKAFDFVTSVLGSAVEKITTGFKAAKVLFDGFFNEKGEFDFIGGIKNLVKNVDCIGPAIVGIGLAFAAVSTALLPVAGLLLPKLVFGGL